MRKYLIFLCIYFLFVFSLTAQVRTGDINGKVVDESGEALPGVTVILTGSLTGAVSFITTAEGIFRFTSLAPAKDYVITAEVQGFKTNTLSGIVVAVGAKVNLTIALELGTISEEVTVTAVVPIIDTKKTYVGVNLSQEILQSIPSSRDPFNIMKMAPGAGTYSEDVGGSEGGQAIRPNARGGFTTQLWVMDGLVINDAYYISCQPTYYDFDSFDSINVTVGGADVAVQTGGIALNVITSRGGNTLHMGGRYYLTDSMFQADNMTQALRDEGLVGTNRINIIRDYGFNIGGPIVKDKAWFYVSYGVQDIQNISRYNKPSETILETFIGKVNFQIIPQNRLEIFLEGNRKLKTGTGATTFLPEGYDRPSLLHFGYPVFKIQDEHTFGPNLFASLKFGWSNGGYIEVPHRDPNSEQLAINDLSEKRGYGGYLSEWTNHPNYIVNATFIYFNDNLFGASHEVKFGFEWGYRSSEADWNYPSNLNLYRNFIDPVYDKTGDGQPNLPDDPNFYAMRLGRGEYENHAVDCLSAFLSDTLSFGRLNITLGVRYDKQSPIVNPVTVLALDRANPAINIFTNQTIDLLDGLLPAVNIPKLKGTAADGSLYSWHSLYPRLSLNYDITGDGKTMAKLSFSQYGNLMATYVARRWMPGGYEGWLYWYWLDNGDYKANSDEFYWYTMDNYELYRMFDDAGKFTGDTVDGADKFWGGYDIANPTELDTITYDRIDKNAAGDRTTEVIFSLEREVLPDALVQVNLIYRKSDKRTLEYKYFPDTNTFIDQSYYVSAGTPPATIPGVGDTGEAKNNNWYYLNAEGTTYSPYTWTKLNPDRFSDYWGIDLVFNKRLSHKWMVNSSFTYQFSAPHWGQTGVLNQTNRWAEDGINDTMLWMFKVAGLYQLPYDIHIAFNLNSHQGRRIRRRVRIQDYTLPNPKSNSANLYLDPKGSETLPAMFNMSVRIEKMLHIMETGKIYFMVDVFNALNLTVAEQRSNKDYGNYYIYTDPAENKFVPNPTYYELTKILNPRVIRFGIRFVF